jgi:hypothetical protein
MEIQTILEKHRFEVEGLLRRHKIAGSASIETIKSAYDKKGSHFMMELLTIITPTSSFLGIGEGKGFLGLGKSTTSESSVYDPLADPLSDETYDALMAETATTSTTGKGWTFWDKLLTNVSKTGDTISKVKSDISGQSAADTALLNAQLQQDASTSNMLYFIAAGFVALIIIILVLKK